MNIKYADEYQIDLVRAWFEARTGEGLPRETLSKYAIVAQDNEGQLLAAVFMYPVMESKVCFLGWPVTNPAADKNLRRKALDNVIIEAEYKAKRMGYMFMNTYASVDAVELRFVEHGYIYGDKSVNQLIKKL